MEFNAAEWMVLIYYYSFNFKSNNSVDYYIEITTEQYTFTYLNYDLARI